MKVLKKGKTIYGPGKVVKAGQKIPKKVRLALEADKKNKVSVDQLEEEEAEKKNESKGASGSGPGGKPGG